jgi:type II secretory pathway pseudopilin PulG
MSKMSANSHSALSGAEEKRRRRAGSEDGYLLIGVLFLVAVVLITLAVAAPKVASEIQRDKELELYHRGLQYQHAIRLYYKKFGRYPNNLEQLEKTNEIRFLRKRYKDPVTGKDEWRLIHFGEQKVKTTGLFGQPISATNTNGLSSAGNTGGASSSPFGSNSGSAFGSNSGSAFGSNSGSAFGSPVGSTSPIGTSPTGTAGGTTGTDSSATGGAGGSDPTATNSTGLAGASTSGISSIGNGQTFGGGGIVGVSSSSQKASIREYRKQKHYNEWEFVYDPASEINNVAGASVQNGAGTQGGGSSAFGSGGFGSNSNSGFGSNSNSGGFGSSSSSSPTTPTTPQPTTPTPQQ